jgi:hypothetical protein
MKIKVEKWIVDGTISYKIVSIDKCCDKLVNSSLTSINTAYDRYQCYDYGNDNIYSVKLINIESTYDSEDRDYYNETNYEEIEFCPWCGEKIEIEIVNTINKTDEYKVLQQKRDILWGKCRKTDSKNKEQELLKQVRELDVEINDMLTSDDFTKEEE